MNWVADKLLASIRLELSCVPTNDFDHVEAELFERADGAIRQLMGMRMKHVKNVPNGSHDAIDPNGALKRLSDAHRLLDQNAHRHDSRPDAAKQSGFLDGHGTGT